MGGSGLIVVVIVAAWALFLVPQWMHRRASAAAHLADRIPPSEGGEAAGSSRLGRRQLVRTRAADRSSPSRFANWHLPSMPRVRRRSRRVSATTPSPAARRRRILTVLALATLVTAGVVGIGALAGLPVPTWLVAIPGGLMVGYLVLLAIMRPGAARHSSVETASMPAAAGESDVTSTEVEDDPIAVAPTYSVGEESVADEAQEAPSTWTPVPLPTPTYVTAPRARRSVRTIDLSNPGSWTTSSTPVPVAATTSSGEQDEQDEYLVEHRRAVGD